MESGTQEHQEEQKDFTFNVSNWRNRGKNYENNKTGSTTICEITKETK